MSIPRDRLLLIPLLSSLVAVTGYAAPTIVTAVNNLPPTAFPDVTSTGFEDPAVTSGVLYHGHSSPGPQWASWTLSGQSGVSYDNSVVTGLNPNAPEGQRVGFLQGDASVETPYAFAAGTWRLRLRAAQRAQSPGNDHQVLRVTIDGTQVAEWEPTGIEYLEYISRPITFDTLTTSTVRVAGLDVTGSQIALIDELMVEPIHDWNLPATWDVNAVPTATDTVVVPLGVVVALTGSSSAFTIEVRGELLASNRDITVESDWVQVVGAGGRLEVGTETTPFLDDFTLTLTATPYSTPFGIAGTKFLMAMMGGTIHLHGKPKVSWTRLDGDITWTSTSIAVSDPVDWEPGDEIVITGTVFQEATDPEPSAPNRIDPGAWRRRTSRTSRLASMVSAPSASGAARPPFMRTRCSAA